MKVGLKLATAVRVLLLLTLLWSFTAVFLYHLPIPEIPRLTADNSTAFRRNQCNESNSILINAIQPIPEFRMFLHPPGKDLYISDVGYNSNGDSSKLFEAEEREYMLNILNENPGSEILDIGANIGTHTLFFGLNGFKVHAFEPLPVNFQLLECSVEINNLHDIILNNVALGPNHGKLCMTEDPANPKNFGALYVSNATSSCEAANLVKVMPLGEYLELNKVKPFFIKIDIEGFEFSALLSAKEHLRKYPPKHIFSEFSEYNMRHVGRNPSDYFKFLVDLGYRIEHKGKVFTSAKHLPKTLRGNIMIHAIHDPRYYQTYHPKDTCDDVDSILVKSTPRELQMFLHEPGKDLYISDVAYDSNGDASKLFESDERKYMLSLLADYPNAEILDIGANIGTHTLFFGLNGYKVHAFEPLPVNFRLLECSVKRNNIENIFLNNAALGPTHGELCMTADPANPNNFGALFVTKSNSTCDPENLVKVMPLGGYLEIHQLKPVFIKIDIEGFELSALSSAKEYFQKYPPKHIYSEFSEYNMRNVEGSAKDYFDFFSELGYRIEHNGRVFGNVNELPDTSRGNIMIHAVYDPKSTYIPSQDPFITSKDVCEISNSIIVEETATTPRFQLFLHPPASDLYISDVGYKSKGDPSKLFESDERVDMLDLIRYYPGAEILDIGANIGTHTLFFGLNGYKVHAFEPLPVNFHLLQCSVKANRVDNIILNNFALGPTHGELCMTADPANPDNFGALFLSDNSDSCDPANIVKVVPLGEYLEKNEVKPVFIKIDIEGFEFNALSSAKDYLLKYPPKHIYSEFSSYNMQNVGGKPEDYFNFLLDLGYRIEHNGKAYLTVQELPDTSRGNIMIHAIHRNV